MFSVDLTTAFPAGVPATFAPGGTNRLVIAVANLGDTPAKALMTLSVYTSSDGQFDSSDRLLDSGSKTTTLRAGKTLKVKYAVDTPQGLPDGDYYLLARIDSGGVVPEDNLANNLAVSSSTVAIRAPFIDFSGTIPPFSDKPVVIGPKVKPVKGSMTLQNNGNVAAKGDVMFAVYASTDDVFDASDLQVPPLRHQVVNIRAGKSKVIKTKVTPPANLPSGSYRLFVVIDFAQSFAESNETNNVAASPNALTVVNTLLS
jgi:subtilase family serine protease